MTLLIFAEGFVNIKGQDMIWISVNIPTHSFF
jgi:hypothetical protein